MWPSITWPDFIWPAWTWPDLEEDAEAMYIISGESQPLGELTFSKVNPKINTKNIVFRLNYGSTLSSATVKKLCFIRPDGKEKEFTGSIYQEQYLQYKLTSTTDLNIKGNWNVCIYIESPEFTGYCGSFSFKVLERYE